MHESLFYRLAAAGKDSIGAKAISAPGDRGITANCGRDHLADARRVFALARDSSILACLSNGDNLLLRRGRLPYLRIFPPDPPTCSPVSVGRLRLHFNYSGGAILFISFRIRIRRTPCGRLTDPKLAVVLLAPGLKRDAARVRGRGTAPPRSPGLRRKLCVCQVRSIDPVRRACQRSRRHRVPRLVTRRRRQRRLQPDHPHRLRPPDTTDDHGRVAAALAG